MKKTHSIYSAPHSHTLGEVRIIAGLWRGRKLPVMTAQGLRPTGDRIKETLFNWLMVEVVGANCLDCFAGSGALGFEALSRQAKKVNFIELNRKVAKQIEQNLQHLSCTQGKVYNQSALHWLNRPADEQFDIVFLDPPFHQNLLSQTCLLLAEHHWIAPYGFIYIEMNNAESSPFPMHWHLLKKKTTGQVTYLLFQNRPNLI